MIGRICLTGGIACGKSLLCRYLNELGVETLDADDVVHELIPEEERRRLAKIVFNDPEARRRLEARIHPLVQARMLSWADSPTPPLPHSLTPPLPHSPTPPLPHSPTPPLRLCVIPLLFEVHWEKFFDIICCVTSTKETQISRMVANRGYSREEAESRMAAQMPVAEKASRSQYVIHNDGSPEELKKEATALVAWLKEQSR